MLSPLELVPRKVYQLLAIIAISPILRHTMPLCSGGGFLLDVLFDPKCAGYGQQECIVVHGFYHVTVEHLFAHLWQWTTVRNVWIGFAMSCMPFCCTEVSFVFRDNCVLLGRLFGHSSQ